MGLPSRAEQVRRLQANYDSTPASFDILVIGGGATGAGIALDAASRGLSVACIERGDFASETSSRSTKLIWAGIRYMATASSLLLSRNLLQHPVRTLQEFWDEMRMVYQCHQERRYMMEQNAHLCNWIPICIPFYSWHVSPPPFGHALFGFFPILAPFVLKFYDALSSFSCPPSYILRPSQARKAFPQMENAPLKYCSVFYEAQHNDARTNLAIALSAAEQGAAIVNYVEMTDCLVVDQRVVGVQAVDRTTGDKFSIRAKKVVFAGGPFTDHLREMENNRNDKDDDNHKEQNKFQPAVRGASGTHIVLPGYYSPSNMGLLDYNTCDGRFLFVLPWEKHTLIGTTDTKGPAESSPQPPEAEVEWLLKECRTYLSLDMKVRRSDVLSAWRGWRPLAVDPHAPTDAPASRDHVISTNPTTGVIFIAGGKWTTWREMAQEVVDLVVGQAGPKCKTLNIKLFGGDGYSETLAIELIQRYGMSQDVAENLAKTYGSRAWEVCRLSKPTHKSWPKFGTPLANNFPYIEADVIWACREYACTIEDVLSRRTRLAFLNKDAALQAIPVVADIMAEELGWTEQVKAEQMQAAVEYVGAYAGRIADSSEARLKEASYRDLRDVFDAINSDENEFLDRSEVGEVAEILGFPLSEEELDEVFSDMDHDLDGKVGYAAFERWWNESTDSPFHKRLSQELGIFASQHDNMKSLGGGTMFG